MRQDPAGYARSCEALADAQPAAVERIEVPALLVTGDEDGSRRRRRCARWPSACSERRVVVLHRCGHWTPVERTEECARELRDFLAAQR